MSGSFSSYLTLIILESSYRCSHNHNYNANRLACNMCVGASER